MDQSSELVESVVREYDNKIIFRRWAATWIDFIVLIAGVATVGAVFEGRLDGLELILALGIPAVYYMAMEMRLGATVGKLAVGIRIIGSSGERPTVIQTLVRTVLRLVEVNPFIFGGIPAGIAAGSSKNKQRIGDMLAKTFVVFKTDVPRVVAYKTLE